MDRSGLKQQLEIKELEIKALLEITQAINNNVAEDSLYKIFKFTAISNLKFKKLCLYVKDDQWIGKVFFGTSADFSRIPLADHFAGLSNIQQVKELTHSGPFSEFDLAIPISHKGSVISLVFIGGMESYSNDWNQDQRLGFLQALSNIMIVAIENRKLARRELEQESFRKEMEIASDVQQLLFPENLPKVGQVILEASYLPHDLVGGDYYDYIPVSKDQFFICVADVSGKGVSAALLMSNFQASLRTLVRQSLNLSEITTLINNRVLEITKGERFITCFLALFDLAEGQIQYVNAGHNPPIYFNLNGNLQSLDQGTTILGAFDHLPFLKVGVLPFEQNSTLFCYTDGLTETLNEAGQEFGTQRLASHFSAKPNIELSRLHQDIIIALDQFKGKNPYHDDITMLSCRIN